MRQLSIGRLVGILALGTALVGCEPDASGPEVGKVHVITRTTAALTEDVARVVVTVTGENIPTPLTSDLSDNAGSWEGTLVDVPVGLADFQAEAFDAVDTGIFAGSSLDVNIVAGQTALVGILLQEEMPAPPFEDAAPVIDAFTANRNLVAPGATVDVTGTAHDPSGGALTYAWSADGGSFDQPTSSAATWTAPDTTGTYNLTFMVTDDADLTAAVTFSIAVQNGNAAVTTTFNTWPAVGAMAAEPTRIDTGEITALSVTASDSDGDTSSYTWSTECAGTFDDAHSQSPHFTLGALPGSGTCTFVVTVSDGRGGENTGSLTLQAGPAPTLTLLPSTVYHWAYDGQAYSVYAFDGSTWTQESTNAPAGNIGNNSYIGELNGVAYHYVYSGGNFAMYAFDGAQWTAVPGAVPSGNLGSVSYVGTFGGKAYHWVYNPGLGEAATYSFDGSTWEVVATGIPFGNVGLNSYLGVLDGKAYHRNGFDNSLYAFDGTAWTQLSTVQPSGNLGMDSYIGTLGSKIYHWFYDWSVGHNVLYAFDGTTWETINASPPGNNVGSASYLGVVGTKVYHWIYDGGAFAAYSFDGSTWQYVTSNGPNNVGGFLTMMGNSSYLGAF